MDTIVGRCARRNMALKGWGNFKNAVISEGSLSTNSPTVCKNPSNPKYSNYSERSLYFKLFFSVNFGKA